MSEKLTRTSRISAVVQRRVPSMFRMDSIKSKILVFALLAALFPSVIMAWVSYVQNKGALTDKITEELQSVSAQTAREMDIWLKERLYDVKVFASSYEVTENVDRLRRAGGAQGSGLEAAARVNDYLTSVRERFTDYNELTVVDLRDTLATAGTPAGTTRLPDGWTDDVQADRAALGDPYWDAARGEAAMALAVPVRGANGQLLGALLAKLNFGAVQTLLQSFLRDDDGVVYLVTADNRVIVTAGEVGPDVMDRTLDADAAAAMRADLSPVATYDRDDGVEVVGALASVPGLDWATVAEVPESVAFSSISRLRNATIVLVVALLLFVGLVAYRLGLLIVRPLDRLTLGAAEVAKGDLAVDLPDAGSGEVGYLTEVFNYMVQRLREGREQLDAAALELREKNEELERLSVTDALTDLYNRRYMMRTLEAEVRRADRMKHPFAILMMDVDHFKSFNDKYGHQAGDEVLVRVGAALKAAIREVDCAARYGGEEFSVLLPETDLDNAADVAERIRTLVAGEPFTFDGKKATVTLSIGVAEYPDDGDAPELLIAAADDALYQAKKKGRNRVVRAPRRGKSRAQKGA